MHDDMYFNFNIVLISERMLDEADSIKHHF